MKKIIALLFVVLLSNCFAQKTDSLLVKRVEMRGSIYKIVYENDSVVIWNSKKEGFDIDLDKLKYASDPPLILAVTETPALRFRFKEYESKYDLDLDGNLENIDKIIEEFRKMEMKKITLFINSCWIKEYTQDQYINIKRMISIYDAFILHGLESKNIEIKFDRNSDYCFDYFQEMYQISVSGTY